MIISDFAYEKKRQDVRKKFNKSGWKLGQYHEHESTHRVYFYHYATGQQFMVGITLDEAFNEIRQTAIKHKNDIGDLVNYLCGQIKLSKHQQEELEMSVSLWAISTQTFELMENQLPLDQFSTLVIFYPGINNDVYIRPVSFPVEKGRVERPEDIIDYVNYALDIDRKNHPERFYQSAEVIQFGSRS